MRVIFNHTIVSFDSLLDNKSSIFSNVFCTFIECRRMYYMHRIPYPIIIRISCTFALLCLFWMILEPNFKNSSQKHSMYVIETYFLKYVHVINWSIFDITWKRNVLAYHTNLLAEDGFQCRFSTSSYFINVH